MFDTTFKVKLRESQAQYYAANSEMTLTASGSRSPLVPTCQVFGGGHPICQECKCQKHALASVASVASHNTQSPHLTSHFSSLI